MPTPDAPSSITEDGVTRPVTRSEAQQFYFEHDPVVVASGHDDGGQFSYFVWDDGDRVQIGDPGKACEPLPSSTPGPGISVGYKPVQPLDWIGVSLPDLDNPTWCADAQLYVTSFTAYMMDDRLTGQKKLAEALGLGPNPDGNPSWLTAATYNVLGVANDTLAWVWSGMLGLTIDTANRNQAKLSEATKQDLWSMAVANFSSQWFGVPSDYIMTPTKYRMQFSYPVLIPGQPELNRMYLVGILDRPAWECYTKAHGNLPNFAYRSLYADRSRLNPAEFVQWMMRQDAPPQEIITALRLYGFLEDREAKQLVDLQQNFPPIGDLIRMMVRDVQNPQAVEDDGLSQGFETNWNGKLQQWGHWQGLSDEVALKYWQAHWQLPAPGQLYEMLHRLRPGEVADNLAVDRNLVERLIRQQDYAPNFVSRLVELSYNVINRSDLHSSYNSGSIDDDRVRRGLQDVGYTAADARTLQNSWKHQRLLNAIRGSGGWTPQRLGQAYLDGSINRETAALYMADFYDDAALVQDLLDRIDSRREAQSRAKCVKGIKDRYMFGEFGEQAARAGLTNLGVDLVAATTLVDGWQCERSSRRKQPTVAILQKWWQRGIISSDDAFARLQRLGYTTGDTQSMMTLWRQALAEAQAKAILAAEKAAAAAAEKARKAAEKAAKDAAPCKPPAKPTCGPDGRPLPPKNGKPAQPAPAG